MKDIQKRSHNSRSNSHTENPLHTKREKEDDLELKHIRKRREKDISKVRIDDKVERYENGEDDDIEYTKDGKPVMRASKHYDRIDSGDIRRRERDEFDVLKRNEFFNIDRNGDRNEESLQSFRKERRRRNKTLKIILYVVLLLALGVFLAMTLIFNRAKVILNPRYQDIVVSGVYDIPKTDLIIDISSSTMSKKVLKSEPKEINRKASGEITIYNNYSDKDQILIRNTRFESPEGKIFRISDNVTVPGIKKEVPGSITVKIIADSYGADYNLKPTTFTIPGLKGNDRYSSFYAKSTSPMTGGISGMVQVVADIDIDTAKNELTPKIESTLKDLISKFTHSDYYTLYSMPVISYSDNQNTLISSTEESYYELSGLATVYSLKKDVISQLLAKAILKNDYQDGVPVKLDSIDNLNFSIASTSDPTSDVLKLNITGRAQIIWTYDETQLKNALKGQKIKTLPTVVEDYNNNYNHVILNATSYVKPFWVRSFPNETKKIDIVQVIN